MKAIVSLFISAYQPGMASIECRYFKELYFEGARFEELCFKDPYFEDARFEDRYFEDRHFEKACFENLLLEEPSYEDVCWMISRARREAPLGYYVMYLRYVSHHSGYAKTVEASLRQHIALHPDLKDSLSTFLATWLQQQEDLFCQTLHQQLIEFHTSH
ncbi:hypothetical protein [Vibrio cyclitrophicus]|uniref:hypothetical protein n=1 Tax=Vibrio cyclitrophicus TaxID=47951 RepID=UPI000C82B11C|nr:hypothetical protein [Vibrio cyclitrophicus]PMK96676.1 hypothetical protein BCT87_09280 [Vibrio cyclitrophicus]